MDAFEVEDVRPCRMHTGDGGIHYMDHNGEFWDEVSHKKLDDEGVRNARPDEIKQFYSIHMVCMRRSQRRNAGTRQARNLYK